MVLIPFVPLQGKGRPFQVIKAVTPSRLQEIAGDLSGAERVDLVLLAGRCV